MDNDAGRSLRDGLSPSVEPASGLAGSAASIPSAGWWYSQNAEYLYGPHPTRSDAIDAGIYEYCGEPFFVCEGARFQYQPPHIDAGWLAENFDDANAEYGPEDDCPSSSWSDEACKELEKELNAVMSAWLDRHGYRNAWAIDASPHEQITASAIEARRAETGTGSVHESAVPQADAQGGQP